MTRRLLGYEWRRQYLAPDPNPRAVVRGIALEWKPQDCWLGAFWRGSPISGLHCFDLWVCVLPMLPVHVYWDSWAIAPAREEVA